MITVEMGGRIGNHLWQYAVGRTVAEHKGFDFYVPKHFQLGEDLFANTSTGINHADIRKTYRVCDRPNFRALCGYWQKYDPTVWDVEDYSELRSIGWETEKYIINNKSNIQKWYTLKTPNTNLYSGLQLDEDVCIINFRGEDFKNLPDVYVHPSFYYNSINHMKSINPNMKFIVITNDVEEGKLLFPGYPVYHFGINDDFYVVNNAKYLIIANSSFSWWAAWLNNKSRFTIAPKYWHRFNANNGWWAPIDIVTNGWFYVDRLGKLFSSNQCSFELIDQDATKYPHRDNRLVAWNGDYNSL